MNLLSLSISKNSVLLALFALATALLLAFTQAGTKDRIEKAERAAAQKALFEVMPREQHDNDMLSDTLAVEEQYAELLGLRSDNPIHVARRQGQPVALVIPAVARDGYGGDIKLLVGVTTQGTITGVRVLAHNETPGLGDKIELKKSPWILNFDGLSLNQPPEERWAVKKDGGTFDQFTGATITPRAVVNRVKQVLRYQQLAQPLTSQPPADQEANTP